MKRTCGNCVHCYKVHDKLWCCEEYGYNCNGGVPVHCEPPYDEACMFWTDDPAKANAWMEKGKYKEGQKATLINWQYCKDPNRINEAILTHDENREGLYTADQIISISYDTNQGCYVVFWRKEP